MYLHRKNHGLTKLPLNPLWSLQFGLAPCKPINCSVTQSLWPSAGSGAAFLETTCIIYINPIIFQDDGYSGAQCRTAFGLFKDIDSGTSSSQDFLLQPLSIDDSTSAFWFSAT